MRLIVGKIPSPSTYCLAESSIAPGIFGSCCVASIEPWTVQQPPPGPSWSPGPPWVALLLLSPARLLGYSATATGISMEPQGALLLLLDLMWLIVSSNHWGRCFGGGFNPCKPGDCPKFAEKICLGSLWPWSMDLAVHSQRPHVANSCIDAPCTIITQLFYNI